MSDEDIKRQMDMAKQFMPGMPNMTPEMMRMATQQIGSMSSDQLNTTLNKAKSMASASPSSTTTSTAPTTQANSQQQPSTKPASSGTSATTQPRGEPKNDLEKANFMKEDANQLVKQNLHLAACEKYFEAINTIRFSERFKNSPEGKQSEMACRLNIALCKYNLADYTMTVEQCERVLQYEPGNWKAAFRMSQALYAMMVKKQGGGCRKDDPQMKSVVEYAQKACEGNPNDAKMKEYYEEVKKAYENAQNGDNQEPVKEEEKKATTADPDEPVIKEEDVKNFACTTQPSTYSSAPISGAPPNLNTMPSEQKAKLVQESTQRIKNMDDQQLKNMVDMMKGNREYMKGIYRAQGMEMSDEQLDMMVNMMSPEMLKSASEMLEKNPDLVNQTQQQMRGATTPAATPVQSTSTVEESKQQPSMMMPPSGMPAGGNMAEMMNNPMVQQMMNNPELMKQAAAMMGGGAAADNASMQSMMQNPSLSGMMQNPEFLENTLKMLKGNKGMLDMMQKQNPNMNLNLMIKALEGITKVASAYKAMKRAWTNVWVRLIVFGLIVLVIVYFFG